MPCSYRYTQCKELYFLCPTNGERRCRKGKQLPRRRSAALHSLRMAPANSSRDRRPPLVRLAPRRAFDQPLADYINCLLPPCVLPYIRLLPQRPCPRCFLMKRRRTRRQGCREPTRPALVLCPTDRDVNCRRGTRRWEFRIPRRRSEPAVFSVSVKDTQCSLVFCNCCCCCCFGFASLAFISVG